MMAVAICPRIVANAAPATPHLNTKIKIGSRTVLITAPVIIEIIAYFGLPSARMIEFIAVPMSTNGSPMRIMRV